MSEKKKELSRAKKWENGVREARGYINDYNKVRWRIVDIANEICDTSHGGRKIDGLWTIKRFADEIDLERKTLYRWMHVKRTVLDKLPTSIQKEPQRYNYELYSETARRIGTEELSIQQTRRLFQEVLDRSPTVRKMEKYNKFLKTILYNVQRPILMKDLDEVIIDDYIKTCRAIVGSLEQEKKLRERFKDQAQQTRKRLNMRLKEIDRAT